MNRLAVTRRQMGLSAGALGLAVVSFMLVASSIARIRGCPAYSATEPKSTEVSNDNPNHLSLLLYNAQLRPRLLFATGQSDRVQQLFPLTEGYDILVVAEAFDDHALNKLKSLYPTGHFSAPLGQNEGLSQDSGLSILSQWPIVLKSQYQKKFDGNCTGSSCFNYQGIITVGIQKDQGPVYHVITAQLQAGNSSKAQSIRQDQYEQVREFIDVMEIPENEPAIFAVSLPISPQTHAAEYEEMIETIGLIPLSVTGKRQYSLNSTENNLTKSDILQTPDALFTLAQSAEQPQSTTLRIRPMRTSVEQGWRSSPLLYWQCPQQNLSDHHAVEGQFNYEVMR